MTNFCFNILILLKTTIFSLIVKHKTNDNTKEKTGDSITIIIAVADGVNVSANSNFINKTNIIEVTETDKHRTSTLLI